MHYYEREHLDAYARVRAEGLDQWDDLHEDRRGYDDFPNRAFLDRVLPPVDRAEPPRVLEYGCGTGPAACFLAARGYDVRGIDLVPDAIYLARLRAAERGLAARFDVDDVCRWKPSTERYDIVLDSYCLQSIVLDPDRDRVLSGVRQRLEPHGRYVLSTAMYDPDRGYGDDRYDEKTGIVWTPVTDPTDDARHFEGAWFLPHRRHLRPDQLAAELWSHGFEVLVSTRGGGDLVCAPA